MQQHTVTPNTSGSGTHSTAGFWHDRPATTATKILLVAVAAFSLASDVLLVGWDVSKLGSGMVPSLIFITLGLVVQGWKATAGTVIVAAGASYCIFVDNASYAAACLAVTAGFVVALTTRRFFLAYVGFVALWCIILVWVQPRELALLPAYLLMVGIGAVIGNFFRHSISKDQQHAQDLQALEQRRLRAIDEERRHLARELHDVIAHDLTIVAMHARVLDIADSPSDRASSQQAIGDSARNALLDLRRMLGALYGPGWDADAPVAEDSSVTLTDQIQRISAKMESLGIEVTTRLADTAGIPRSIELALLRTVRESTTNILKHVGDSTRVTIEVTRSLQTVELSVSNTPPEHSRPMHLPESGFGLMGMRERMALFAGTFSAGPDNHGWTVRASIPLQ
ncbi:histidine kinase [Arthrobacter sp. H35-D1]|uniref:sensor histidine kinase n=1 Tax=Arthrobacter sp. H35-D1 TaxID=3046202 RepID=UPI0024BA9FAD|nr:histidine kinase [Arthrobacter sp. H35-D1]MDJ0312190.1 histidine kinase [Arthrobacter sp. H35-D1]